MSGVFFDVTATDTAQIYETAKAVITDFSPIWLIVIAVGVGTIILTAIISAIKK